MRTFIAAIMFLLFFVLLLPVVGVLFIIRKHDEEKASWVTYRIVKTFIRMILFVSGTRLIVEGAENIPEEQVLFVGNHSSYFDILCTYVNMKRPGGYVAKKEIGKVPVMNLWMKLMNCVFIDRNNIKEGLKTIIEAIGIVKKGYSMVIFPEGTRNRGINRDIPGEFKEGSLKIAGKAGCRIVPVAIKNTESCFEEHFPFIRPATVRVSYLKPFYENEIPEEYKKKPAAYTRMLIEKELERPL